MDEKLHNIVTKMVAAGESEDNIALVIKHYNQENVQQPAAQIENTPKPEENSGFVGAIKSGLNLANDYAGIIERKGANLLLSDTPKFLGHVSEAIERHLPDAISHPHKSFLTQAGEDNEKLINNITDTPTIKETEQTLGGQVASGIGQMAGMAAGGGFSTAAKGLALTETAVPSAARLFGSQLATPTSALGSIMTAEPEFESAKQNGKTDDEAFNTLIKNYFIGSTESLPIEGMFHRLDAITGGGIKKNIARYLGGVAKGGLAEATQEGLQTYLTNQVAKADYDPDRDPLFGMAESMTVGGLVGMLIPGIGGAIKVASPDNKIKLQKKLVDLQAKAAAVDQVDTAIHESTTGNPDIDASIDQTASLSKEELDIISQKKANQLANEQAVKETEERQKEIDKSQDALDKHDIAKKKSEDGKGNLLPEEVKEHKNNIKQLQNENETEVGLRGPIQKRGEENGIEGNAEEGSGSDNGGSRSQEIRGGTDEQVELSGEETQALKDKAIAHLNSLANFDHTNSTDEEKQGYYKELQEARNTLAQLKPAFKANGKSDIKSRIDETTGVKKPEKSVKMTPGEAIKKQMTDFYNGVKEGVYRGKNLSNELLTKVQTALKGSQLTNQQTSSILSKIKNTNLFTAGSVSRLNDHISKIANDAEYADKLDQANTLQKRIKSKVNSPTFTASEKKALHKLASVNPEHVNLDAYLAHANQVAKSFRSVARETLDIAKTHEYVNSVKPEIEAAQAQDELELANADQERNIEEETAETPEDKKAAIKQKATDLAEHAKQNINPEIKGSTPGEEKTLATFKNADLSVLTVPELKQYIKSIDRINVNGDFGGTGPLSDAIEARKEFKDNVVKKLEGANIFKLIGVEAGMKSVPMAIHSIFGLADDAGHFQEGMSMNDVMTATVKADESENQTINTILSEDNKKHEGYTDESIFNQFVFAELIRHDEDQTPEEAIEQTHKVLQQDLANTKKQDIKAYATKEKSYAPFKDAKSLEEVKKIMEKIDPVGAKIVYKLVDTFTPVGDRMADYNNRYHNENTVKSVNYSGARTWLGTQGTGIDELDDMSNLDPGNLASPRPALTKPKQVSTAKRFTNAPRTDALLNWNKHATATNSMRRSIFALEGTSPMIKLRDKVAQRSALERLFGSKEDGGESVEKAQKLYDTMFGKHGLYTVMEDQMAKRTAPSSPLDRKITGYLNTLKKMAYSTSLGGLTQYPKQLTVMTNTAMQLGPKAFAPIVELTRNPEGANLFFEGKTISERGAEKEKVLLADISAPRGTQDYKQWFQNFIDRGAKSTLFGLKPMTSADALAAKASYVAYYKDYLQRHGEKYQGFDKENELKDTQLRKDAHAIAKHRVDITQGVSSPYEMGTWLKNKSLSAQFAKASLMPFGTFTANTKSRTMMDYKIIATGTSQQKKEAMKDLVGSYAEAAVFTTVNKGLKWGLRIGTSAALVSLFGLPEDAKEKAKEWENLVKSWYTDIFMDSVPIMLTSPGNAAFLESVNYMADKLLNVKNPLYNPKPLEQTKIDALFSNIGTLGVAIDRIRTTGSIAKMAATGIKTDKHDKGHKLTEEQRIFAIWATGMHLLNDTGRFPSDIMFAIDKELNTTKPGKHATKH